MKYFLIPALLVISLTADAGQKYDPSRLNPCLKNLYERILENKELIGKTHTCRLSLKFSSEKWLLFHDGYVGLDQSSKYSFLKFIPGMKIPKDISANKTVDVTFKIMATSESLAPGEGGWPAMEVQLLKINQAKR